MARDDQKRNPSKDGLMPDSQTDEARGIPERQRAPSEGADDRPTPAPGDPGKTPGPPASGTSGEPTRE